MRRRTTAAAIALGIALTLLHGAPPAHSGGWAPAASASIHPGVQMVTGNAQCTANFVFTEGAAVYLGYAAHCAGTGDATDTNGCTSGSLPIGTAVRIQGATRPGVLAYSSWLTMQQAGETDADACAYNDFALVRVDPADVVRVNPSLPFWGGPRGLDTGGNPALSAVYSYGRSSLRDGLELLSPHSGTSLGTSAGGWTHAVYTITPGIPGDSGSAYLDAGGNATGVLSTISIAPLPASNNIADLDHVLRYMNWRTGGNVRLALGTEAFDPDQLPLEL